MQNGRRHVVLIDGHCGLCRATEAWVNQRDKNDRFKFHPLQSPEGQKWLERVGLPTDTIDTMVLVEDHRAFLRSTASLRIARRLGFPWILFYGCIIVPKPLRDAAYRFVARNRHRIRRRGKQASCAIHGQEK